MKRSNKIGTMLYTQSFYLDHFLECEHVYLAPITDKVLTTILLFILSLHLFICLFEHSVSPHSLFHLLQWAFRVHFIFATTVKLDNEINDNDVTISPLENRWSLNLNPPDVGHCLNHSGSLEKCTLCSSAQCFKSSARRTLLPPPFVYVDSIYIITSQKLILTLPQDIFYNTAWSQIILISL